MAAPLTDQLRDAWENIDYFLQMIDDLKAENARLEKECDRMTARYIDAINRVPEPILPDCPMSDQARKIIDDIRSRDALK